MNVMTMQQAEKFWLKLLAFASEFFAKAQRWQLCTRAHNSKVSPLEVQMMHGAMRDRLLPVGAILTHYLNARASCVQSTLSHRVLNLNQNAKGETKKLQLPPPVKPPPPLHTRFRID